MNHSEFQHLKEITSLLYYIGGALAFLAAVIRVLYGWFRNYDNSVQFTAEMATVHLPYLYKGMQTIANGLGLTLEPIPPITFAKQIIPGLTPPHK